MKIQIARLLPLLAVVACANAQTVPVGSAEQSVIARFFGGISCTPPNAQTGFGTAALYVPYMPGIPEQFLFRAGSTVHDQTTATLTGVFQKLQLRQSQNGTIVNTFLPPNSVSYYYHPNSSPKDWTDFDGFQTGQLIGVYQVGTDMFSTVNGVSFGLASGPFTFSDDFVLPDGTQTNIGKLHPGGITVATVADLQNFIADPTTHAPVVVNLSSSSAPVKNPVVLGSCAVMFPFSGVATNPGKPTPVGFNPRDVNSQKAE